LGENISQAMSRKIVGEKVKYKDERGKEKENEK
jgi:hypothetical protein